MIEIDGSLHSGSGTLLRYSVALSTLIREPLHMTHIRLKRNPPGLRPQHLQAVQACNAMSGGHVEGAEVGSTEITYHPGGSIRGGDFRWDIGTAGSTTMLGFTLIPLALFADRPCRFLLAGGLFQDFAPSAFHMGHVLFPLLQKMGAEVSLDIQRPGYVPKGQGRILLRVEPLKQPLSPLSMREQGTIRRFWGISFASHLAEQQVARRMAEECRRLLQPEDLRVELDVREDLEAVQRGAALFLRAETDTESLLGADRAGRQGRPSESIARFVVRSLLEDLRTGATTDRHVADQLILFAALANGSTQYVIPTATDHVASNLWLVREFLGCESEIQGHRLKLRGVGMKQAGPLHESR